ncbi:MAG: hypothetical protein RL757_3307 [Bacteroidota bacterium]|jgi:hypothetical protein
MASVVSEMIKSFSKVNNENFHKHFPQQFTALFSFQNRFRF